MQTGLQILEQPFRTKNLFSKHYLETSFKDPKQNPYWDKVNDENAQAFKQIKELWLKKSRILIKLKESQLEDEFIRPVMKALAHVWDVQATIPHAFGTFGTPDYAFFRDEETKDKVKQDKHVEYFKATIGLGEAKAWDENLDKRKKAKEKEQRVIPSSQINTYLKVSGVNWGILTNGRLWRLYYRETSFNLDSYYETDLPELLQFGSVEQFKYFFLLFRKEAFVLDQAGRCFLDDVYGRSIELAKELEENVKENVYEALRLLAYGFLEHPDNKLDQSRLKEIHDNCLILLYRLLFILYAEARGLLPADNPVYASVSLHQLKKDVADALSSPTKVLLVDSATYWSRLKTLFSWINEGSEKRKIPKEQLHIPPYNGGLFDPSRHPVLENNRIGDKYLAKAIELLTRAGNSKAGIKGFIDYSTLAIRHLGSVYEGLLEYKLKVADQDLYPVKEKGREVFVPLADIQKQKKGVDDSRIVRKEDLYLVTDKGERKATGSYFTPDYIVKYIVESTLGLIVDEKKALKNGKSPIENILSIKVLDPAMGSGHFLVEATSFLASKIIDAMQEAGEEVDEGQDIVWARRLVVERCIYGVDLNPLAVELAKVSLWLHTIAQDKALSFLDHHLKCGDSLIGTKIDEVAKGLPTEKAKSTYTLWGSYLKVTMKEALAKRLAIQVMPSDTPEQIKQKERILRESDELVRRSKQVADLFLSAYFGNDINLDEYAKVLGDIALIEDEWLKYEKKEWFRKALEIAGEKRFFHWELEFPEVFFDETGPKENVGFDVVIGNPPYYSCLRISRDELSLFIAKYSELWASRNDISYYFYVEFFKMLRLQGIISLIFPRYYLSSDYADEFRDFLVKEGKLLALVDTGNCQVFPDANILTTVLTTQQQASGKHDLRYLVCSTSQEKLTVVGEYRVEQSKLYGHMWNLRELLYQPIFGRIEKVSLPLGSIVDVGKGMSTGCNQAFEINAELAQKFGDKSYLRDLIKNGDIRKYFVNRTGRKVIYLEEVQQIEKYPEYLSHMLLYKTQLLQRRNYDGPWFKYSTPRNKELWDRRAPKIVAPFMATENRFAVETREVISTSGDVNVLLLNPNTQYSLYFLCGLLNSKLLEFVHRNSTKLKRAGYMEYVTKQLTKLPIRKIAFNTRDSPHKDPLQKIINAYEQELQGSQGWQTTLSIVEELLAGGAASTRAVHDFIAHLAMWITSSKEQKKEECKDFLDWLGRELSINVDQLQSKTAIKEYYDLEFEAFLSLLRLSQDRLSIGLGSRDFQKSLKAEFERSVNKIKRLDDEAERTLGLVDQVVYRLYGLTEEEIAVVEGRR